MEGMVNTDSTNLTQNQLDSLNVKIKRDGNLYPDFKELIDYLKNNEIKVGFRIDSLKASKGAARCDPSSNVIYYYNDECFNASFEDFTHAAQFQGYYKNQPYGTITNIEFEAKLFKDICCAFKGEPCFMIGSGYDNNTNFDIYYNLFFYIYDNEKLPDDFITTYKYLGTAWNDSNYPSNRIGVFNPAIPPLLIQDLIK